MALADIARFDENQPISLRDISLRQGISINYLEQLFLKLKKLLIVFQLSQRLKLRKLLKQLYLGKYLIL